MVNRVVAFGWSIDLAPGWTAAIRQAISGGETTKFVTIAPETDDALLRLTPNERGMMAASEWLEAVGRINRAMGRPVSAVRCGDFLGNLVEFESAGEWIRGWALCCNSSQLDATYRCKTIVLGRDDPVVDKMLNTLSFEVSPQSEP
jgi:hypothetical protein